MEQLLLPTLIIVGISILLLSVGLFIKGKFVNSHVSGNKELAKRGVPCATSQFRDAHLPNPHRVAEHRSAESPAVQS
ncbi:MAG: hypothetical protein HUK09_00520 [Bacteroidaceae bacterium]|nr:hypothetical protein [Bacteroidaceae bacterium]